MDKQNESMYDTLNELLKVSLTDLIEEPYYNSKIKAIFQEFREYSIYDLLVLAKIDILFKNRAINEKTHSNLIKLYNSYVSYNTYNPNYILVKRDNEKAEKIERFFNELNLLDEDLSETLTSQCGFDEHEYTSWDCNDIATLVKKMAPKTRLVIK